MKKQNIKVCVIDENLKITVKYGMRKVSKIGSKRTAELTSDTLQKSKKKNDINNYKNNKWKKLKNIIKNVLLLVFLFSLFSLLYCIKID